MHGFLSNDLSFTHHQVPLSPEKQKLTRLILGGKQYTYTCEFHGLCGLQNSFSRLSRIHFDPVSKRKQAITYIDDTKLQSRNKNEMFTVFNECHTLFRKAGLKAAPDKTFFFLKKVKFLVTLYPQKEFNPSQNELKTWKVSNHPKVNDMSWKFLDALV